MKKFLIIISTTLLFFFVVACHRDVSSSDYLIRKVEKDLQEVYSITHVATPVIKEYISRFHEEVNVNKIKMNDKEVAAMIYGLDFNGEEKLIFIPKYRTSKIISLNLSNSLDFKEVLERIKKDYSKIIMHIKKI